MSIRATVEHLRNDPRLIRDFQGGILVTTDCLYPSMSSVAVLVEGGADTCVVHDNCGAIFEAASSGARFELSDRILRPIAKSFGLLVSSRGAITTRKAPTADLGASILMVANASREAALALLSRYRPLIARSAKEVVHEILQKRFAQERIHRDFEIAGASKNHKFDYGVDFENGTTLVLDIVSPDASSINAAVVAGFDVTRRPSDTKLIQRIVYDEQLRWNQQDLALLSMVGLPVQLSSLRQTIDRLAA